MSTNKLIAKDSKNINSSFKSQEVQKRSIFKPLLTNPYTRKNTWPKIDPQVQEDLLQALESNTLQSIKQWNILSPQERGNLSPQLDDHEKILTGFNSIMEALENQIQSSLRQKSDKRYNDNEITMLFVCKNDISSRLLYMHFPMLCALANVKLITLPKGSAKRLAMAIGIKRDVQFLALRKKLSEKDKFVSTTIYSTVDDIKVGFLDNINREKLDMNVKFVLTQMPILKKEKSKTKK